jgi:hypothetical protein
MKVCPFCFADVPLHAATCARCHADLVRYLPADTVTGEPQRSRRLTRLLAVIGGIFILAAALGVYYPLVSRPAAPAYREIGTSGSAHLVVLPATEAAHDADLWRIANAIRHSAPTVDVMFWTNGSAPSKPSLTAADRQRMVAEIVVDVPSGVRRLTRSSDRNER